MAASLKVRSKNASQQFRSRAKAADSIWFLCPDRFLVTAIAPPTAASSAMGAPSSSMLIYTLFKYIALTRTNGVAPAAR